MSSRHPRSFKPPTSRVISVASKVLDVPVRAYKLATRDDRDLTDIKEAFAERMRRVAEQRLLAPVSATVLATMARYARHSPKGFAARILAEHRFQQDLTKVPHLGALHQLTRYSPTRFDYALLIMEVLLRIRQQHLGLGLGSNNAGIRHEGKELSGLEVAQTWALILNWGHLFGTFATERNVLREVVRTPRSRQEFLRSVDPALTAWCQPVLNEGSPYRFFYVLAAWRISRLPDSATKRTIIEILQRFPITATPDPRFEKIAWSYKRARQIAYTRIQTCLRIGFALEESLDDRLIHLLRDSGEVGFDRVHEEQTSLQSLFDALDNFHAEALFSSKDAARIVLMHLRAFKRWWNTVDLPLDEKVQALFTKPVGWIEVRGEPSISHWLRLRLPDSGIGWMGDVDGWLSREDVWQDANFLMTPLPGSPQLLVDVYSQDVLPANTASWIAKKLSERNLATWSADTTAGRELWRSVAAFGLRVFGGCLKSGFACTLEPCLLRGERVGYALIAPNLQAACARLRALSQRIDEDVKKREIEAVLQELQHNDPASTGVWLVFLGTFRIVAKDSGISSKELDGVYAEFRDDRQAWYVLEHKSGGQRGNIAQLEQLREYLAVGTTPPERRSSVGGRAALLRFTSP